MICNIQPNCDDICFDQMNSTFCNELKLADGCNQFDKGNNSILSLSNSYFSITSKTEKSKVK